MLDAEVDTSRHDPSAEGRRSAGRNPVGQRYVARPSHGLAGATPRVVSTEIRTDDRYPVLFGQLKRLRTALGSPTGSPLGSVLARWHAGKYRFVSLKTSDRGAPRLQGTAVLTRRALVSGPGDPARAAARDLQPPPRPPLPGRRSRRARRLSAGAGFALPGGPWDLVETHWPRPVLNR